MDRFFAVAFLMALGRTLVDGDLQVWSDVMNASFDQAAFAFEVSPRIDRSAHLVDGHNESRGKGRGDRILWPPDQSFLLAAFSRHSQGASRNGAIFHEHIGQHARP